MIDLERLYYFSSLSINDKEEEEFELDESYFEAKRIRRKGSRGMQVKHLYLDY